MYTLPPRQREPADQRRANQLVDKSVLRYALGRLWRHELRALGLLNRLDHIASPGMRNHLIGLPAAQGKKNLDRFRGDLRHRAMKLVFQSSARVDRSNYASVNHGTPSHPEGMGVNARQDRQQNRINQGVHSGQMTPGETRNVEHNETNIHNEARTDRQENGGHLTGAEHNHIEHQQNHESQKIYNDKHNARTDTHPNGGAKNGGEKGGGGGKGGEKGERK